LASFDPRDKVLGFYKPELKPDPTKLTSAVAIPDLSIRSYGNFAIAIALLSYTIISEGKVMPPRNIRATVVLKKEKADWKITSAQYTGIRPPAGPPKAN
jgi:ketosteroid isomerase-like protein